MNKMIQHNTLNVKWFNSQLNKLKSGIKNGNEIILNSSSNAIADFSDETNFSHKLSLTDSYVSKLRKDFANNSSGNINLSNTQLSKSQEDFWVEFLHHH